MWTLAVDLDAYLPIGILVLIALGFAAGNLIVTHLFGPRKEGPRKNIVYESGMNPVGTARKRFNVRFYILAMTFLVFDVEIIFLYPWAVTFAKLAPRREYRKLRLQIGKILMASDPELSPMRYPETVDLGKAISDPTRKSQDLLKRVQGFLPPPTAPIQTRGLLKDLRAVLQLELLCIKAVDGLKKTQDNPKPLKKLEHNDLSESSRLTMRKAETTGLGPIRVARLLPIVITPYRFRRRQQFWKYCGLGIVMRSNSDWVQTADGARFRRRSRIALAAPGPA